MADIGHGKQQEHQDSQEFYSHRDGPSSDQIVSRNIEIFKRSTAKGGEKRATIFHEGPGDARKDEQAR